VLYSRLWRPTSSPENFAIVPPTMALIPDNYYLRRSAYRLRYHRSLPNKALPTHGFRRPELTLDSQSTRRTRCGRVPIPSARLRTTCNSDGTTAPTVRLAPTVRALRRYERSDEQDQLRQNLMMDPLTPAIELKNVSKAYGASRALTDVNL